MVTRLLCVIYIVNISMANAKAEQIRRIFSEPIVDLWKLRELVAQYYQLALLALTTIPAQNASEGPHPSPSAKYLQLLVQNTAVEI